MSRDHGIARSTFHSSSLAVVQAMTDVEKVRAQWRAATLRYRARQRTTDPVAYRQMRKAQAERQRVTNPVAYRNRMRAAKRRYIDRLRGVELEAYLEKCRLQKAREYKRKKRRLEKEVIARVRSAIPASLPRDVRDDIGAAMLLEVARRQRERRPRLDIEAAAPDFIRAYWRENSQFGTVSLDAPLYPGGPARIDTIAAPDGDD